MNDAMSAEWKCSKLLAEPVGNVAILTSRPGMRRVARLAAVGDLHIRPRTPITLEPELLGLSPQVDALIITGDITDSGRMAEVTRAARLFASMSVPVVAVLGNHDLRCLRRTAFRKVLEEAGVAVLNGDTWVVTTAAGLRIGFAGVGGCGGGFWPVEGPHAIHSRAFKALALRSFREVRRLDRALSRLDADFRVAITHFAPTISTLGDEPLMKYWMLGNCELGRVVDRHVVDLVFHGHAHLGNPAGQTAGGTPVRNVAYSVTGGVVFHDVVISSSSVEVGREPAYVRRGPS